jgi:hypothetical protein
VRYELDIYCAVQYICVVAGPKSAEAIINSRRIGSRERNDNG